MNRGSKLLLATAALVLLLPRPLAAAPARITGTVRLQGQAPKPARIEPTTDTAICSQQDLLDESLVVDPESRGIRGLVVWLEGSRREETKAPKVLLDNWRCRYEPHVVVLRKAEAFSIRNRDRFLHTAQARLKAKTEFNVALPIQNQVVERQFKEPGVYRIQCDVHPWMRAWAFVLEDEIASTTGPDGSFELDGVPPGKHRLRFWHESLGEKTVEVTVEADKSARVDLTWAR